MSNTKQHLRNRAKGQIAMVKGTLMSVIRDCSDVVDSNTLDVLKSTINILQLKLLTWDPHYVKDRYGKTKED